MPDPKNLKGYYPCRINITSSGVNCQWLYLGDVTFNDPFFEETVARGLSHSLNSNFERYQHSIEDLPKRLAHIKHVEPAAIIFHVSRCGSTLLSQLLGIDERVISLAEVPFFDDILRLQFRCPEFDLSRRSILLAASIKIYGQKRTGHEKYLFVKTDSWHIFFWRTFRQLYPRVPFVLLYRRPDEVIRSHQKLRGMQAVPYVIEPSIFGFSVDEVAGMSLDEYIVLVLERYFSTYLEIVQEDQNIMLLNYDEGPLPIIEKTAAIAGISLAEDTIIKIKERAGYHSKYPGQLFNELQLDQKPPDYMKKLFGLYEQIEAIRINQANDYRIK